MKWQASDLSTYFQSKEYIDTLCIPLIPVSISNESDSIRLANYKRTLDILSNELERHFTGRIMLSPTYSYQAKSDINMEKKRLNEWIKEMSNDSFSHVFFITFDVLWKKEEKELDGTLIWIPANRIDDYQSDETKRWINQQTEQISELIRSFW
ncbi:DUF2487 family protein [Gracilibacillus marinus]|jgi:hypothetical protein|uniref:DUF2487 family protein n=1 Tax=Gracilibacillus marinus TaxID=630535 RepID=A0ABV8VT78_9BACI